MAERLPEGSLPLKTDYRSHGAVQPTHQHLINCDAACISAHQYPVNSLETQAPCCCRGPLPLPRSPLRNILFTISRILSTSRCKETQKKKKRRPPTSLCGLVYCQGSAGLSLSPRLHLDLPISDNILTRKKVERMLKYGHLWG